MDLQLGKFEKRRPTLFLKIYISLHRITSKCHLHNRNIVLSCYVALILQMKDFCFANSALSIPAFYINKLL